MEREASLWKPLDGGKVECRACARYCRIPEGSRGFCFVRQNRGGKLQLSNYGVLEAIQIDPIEKKPFNHFHPGTSVLGIGTSSCNFGCLFCQNHNISKAHEIKGSEYLPEEIVELALRNNVEGIAYTYNEPTIFIEYALDVAKIAKKNGLFNVFVSNGYMTEDAVNAMNGLVDAVVVNFKGNGEQKFSNKFESIASSEPIKDSLIRLKDSKIHIEITDLVIPGDGDSLEACDDLTKWIAKNLGKDTPIQFIRFYPDYKMLDGEPTSLKTLKMHYDVAKRNGLQYVYLGNVPGNELESTYCPECGGTVVERFGYYIKSWNMDENLCCNHCKHRINMVAKSKKDLRIHA